MKQSISPRVGGAVIVLVLLIVSFLTWRGTRVEGARNGETPPEMPANVAAEFNRRMETLTPNGTR